MCLINFHFHHHPYYKLIVVANRDESYARPTANASFWEDEPAILAGRDLQQGGTWLGISKTGRFAALTNYRDPSLALRGQFSRGEIVRQFLAGHMGAQDYIETLSSMRQQYDGYNVIVGNSDHLIHYNNILNEVNVIVPGTHSLSNHTLNTPWPKVKKAKSKLSRVVGDNQEAIPSNLLFEILNNREMADDRDLPNTGVGIELERQLSPIFIKMPNYGTRSSTVLSIDQADNVMFAERVYKEGHLFGENQFIYKIEHPSL